MKVRTKAYRTLFGAIICLSFSHVAHASSEYDRRYSLETVGVLRAWDNVDGLFGDYVLGAYQSYFASQSRFQMLDLTKADQVLQKSKIPYVQLIEDPEILKQIARVSKAQTLLRTKIYKEGPKYRVVLDWIHAEKLELLATETTALEPPPQGQALGATMDFKNALGGALARMIGRLPFIGHINGRDGDTFTINIGRNAGLKAQDRLMIATLEEVRVHPLLKTLAEWRLLRTGKLLVQEVDEGMAFCKLEEEEYGRPMARFQKIVQLLPSTEDSWIKTTSEDQPLTDPESGSATGTPRNGYFATAVGLGGLSRQASSLNGTSGKEGDGLFIQFRAETQLWLTKTWFADLALGYGLSSYNQRDILTGVNTPAGSVLANVTDFRLAGGYLLHLTDDFFGPRGWGRFGYQSTRYSLPLSETEETSPTSFRGLLLGLGGALPVREDFGFEMNLDFGVLMSGRETGRYLGDASGASSVRFQLVAYQQLKPRVFLRGIFEFQSHNMDFSSGNSLSNKSFVIGPGLVLFF